MVKREMMMKMMIASPLSNVLANLIFLDIVPTALESWSFSETTFKSLKFGNKYVWVKILLLII